MTGTRSARRWISADLDELDYQEDIWGYDEDDRYDLKDMEDVDNKPYLKPSGIRPQVHLLDFATSTQKGEPKKKAKHKKKKKRSSLSVQDPGSMSAGSEAKWKRLGSLKNNERYLLHQMPMTPTMSLEKKKRSMSLSTLTTKIDVHLAPEMQPMDRFHEPVLSSHRNSAEGSVATTKTSMIHHALSTLVANENKSTEGDVLLQMSVFDRVPLTGSLTLSTLQILWTVSETDNLDMPSLSVVPLLENVDMRNIPSPSSMTALEELLRRKLTATMMHPTGTTTAVSQFWTVTLVLKDHIKGWISEWRSDVSPFSHSPPPQSPSTTDLILSVCEKLNLVAGQSVDSTELVNCWISDRKQQILDSATGTSEAEPETETIVEKLPMKTCLVCFDTFDAEDGVSGDQPSNKLWRFGSCGHGACQDCWTGQIEACVGSGATCIPCVASHTNCGSNLQLQDVASISLAAGASPANQKSEREQEDRSLSLVQRMLKFDLEKNASKLLKGKTFFCPNPSCCSFISLPEKSMETTLDHRDLAVCHSCGTFLCAACGDGTVAHPGVTCDAYRRFQKNIESGKLDDELASVRWVVQSSRPCPKCRYPIERYTGCNHVRCLQCQYYFCWECGGEGQLCMAYNCKNNNKYWEQDPHYRKHGTKLNGILGKMRTYRMTELRLRRLQKNLSEKPSHEDNMVDDGQARVRRTYQDYADFALEAQLQQVLFWLRTWNLVRAAEHQKDLEWKETTSFLTPIQRLELVIHSMDIRKSIIDRRKKLGIPVEYTGDESASEFAFYEVLRAFGGCSRPLSKGPTEAFDMNTSNMFTKLVADQELLDLCQAKRNKFESSAQDAIRDGIKALLLPGSNATKTKSVAKRCRKSKKSRSSSSSLGLPLNERLGREKAPWKNGFVADASSSSANSSDDGKDDPKSRRWKNSKGRRLSRRANAIDRRDQETGGAI